MGNVSPAGTGLAAAQFTPGAGVQEEAAIASGRGQTVRPIQVDTTNALLRRILTQLEHLNGRAGHPEARHQRATQAAFMDVIGT